VARGRAGAEIDGLAGASRAARNRGHARRIEARTGRVGRVAVSVGAVGRVVTGLEIARGALGGVVFEVGEQVLAFTALAGRITGGGERPVAVQDGAVVRSTADTMGERLDGQAVGGEAISGSGRRVGGINAGVVVVDDAAGRALAVPHVVHLEASRLVF